SVSADAGADGVTGPDPGDAAWRRPCERSHAPGPSAQCASIGLPFAPAPQQPLLRAPSCRPRVARRAILRGMSLTLGPAPLGNKPAGVFNSEPEREGLLYLEPSPRRIRGIAGGATVIDSREARMLHEYGRLPIYLFPRE